MGRFIFSTTVTLAVLIAVVRKYGLVRALLREYPRHCDVGRAHRQDRVPGHRGGLYGAWHVIRVARLGQVKPSQRTAYGTTYYGRARVNA